MISSADGIPTGSELRADLCVVGAGPAGIALALAAAETGADVLLLESGGRRPDAASQRLCEGDVANPALHPPADRFRRRGLGGCGTVWGGRCAPLDPIDFAPRPWLNLPSTWPIDHATLLPFWRRAHPIAELGRFDYAAATAVPGGMRPMFQGFAAPTISTDRIERFSRPTDFGVACAPMLEHHQRVRVLLHATVTNIALAPGLCAVRCMDVATRAGTLFQAYAAAFVLATGGIEAPRLLLASRADIPAGIGNAHGMVGRHYMSHLAGTLGSFVPAPRRPPWHGYEQTAEGVYCRRRLSVEPWAQQAWRIGNVIARLHHPPPADPSHRSGVLSAVHLASRLLPPEYTTHGGTGAWDLLLHLANIAADPFAVARFAGLVARRRLLAARKYPSLVVAPRGGRFAIEIHAEQLPNPESRITLAGARDRFGVPKPRIDWRVSELDIRTVRVTMSLLAEALAAGGHGTLTFDQAALEADILRGGAYGGHHLGTTRMADSPRTGVVDADCRVHGVANLYVAGGAVFATSGQANPTLTILALALRLADHLGHRLRKEKAQPARQVAKQEA